MNLYSLCIATLFTSSMLAQESATMVLDKHYQTIGGLKHIASIQNIYAKAHCSGPNGKYQTEIQSASNSKTIFRQSYDHKADYMGITNDDVFWTKGEVLMITDNKTAFVWRSHEIQWIATHLTERFHELKFTAYENFDGKEAIKLTGLDELNRSAFLYFEKTSNLFLGYSIFSPFSDNSEIIQLTINEWRKIGKILLPSKVTFKDGSGQFELNFHTIKINSIKNSVFEIPQKIINTKILIELHELQRTAHFTRDAKLLVSIMSDDFTEINKGKIKFPKKEDLINRFQAYFDAVTFIEWDDINPPIITISEDATLANMIVNKRVKLKNQDGREETTIFAWLATFKKINGKWLLTGITSTNQE